MGGMGSEGQPVPQPRRDEARERLGAALRRVRLAAGLSTRQVPKGESGGFYTSAHISLVEAGTTMPSVDLIEAYVRLGGDSAELGALHKQADAAVDRRRRFGSEAPETRPPHDALSVVDRDEVRRHYVVVANDVRYRFDRDGAIRDISCLTRLRAKTPGVRLYASGYSYPADLRPGVLSVEPLEGVSVGDVRESETGMIAFYLTLDRDLDPSDPDPYTLSFRVHVDSPIRALPRLRYFADVGIERLVLRADFDVEPWDPWWFAASDIVEAENRRPGRDLTPDGDGGYERTFDDLIPTWCYGFAWSWDTPQGT